MDSMWLLAIKAFEVNKLQLFTFSVRILHVRLSHGMFWNDAKSPPKWNGREKETTENWAEAEIEKNTVNLNESMLASELKRRSTVDSKHTRCIR